MARPLQLWCHLFVAALAVMTGAVQAAIPADEYALKAAFVLNFVALTDWPANTGTRIEVCVLGHGPADSIARAIDGKPAGSRTLAVRTVRSRGSLAGCNVVYITREETGDAPRTLAEVSSEPVLTIAEAEGLAQRGAMINLAFSRDRVVFEINQSSIRRTPLSLSSKLMRLAVAIY